MKKQWGLILALIFALVIAIFSVANVDPVTVNYLFGEAKWPLVLVIIGSVLMGGLIVASIGIFKLIQLQMQVKKLKKQLKQQEDKAELTPTPVEDQETPTEELEVKEEARGE